MTRLVSLLAVASLVLAVGCASEGQRVPTNVEAVATHDFNPTDLQIIGKKSVADLLKRADERSFLAPGVKPVVYISPVRNVTDEHVNVEMIRDYITSELDDSGKVRLSGVSKELAEATKQLEFQQGSFVDPSTARKIGKMIGAGYFVQGELTNDVSKAGWRKGQYFLFTLTFVNIETLEVVTSRVEIQKVSKRGLFGW